MEGRGFEKDRRRRIRDFGMFATHDARDRDRPFRVGDDQHGGIEPVFAAIERPHRFPVLRASDDDAMVGDPVEVEGVHRLTEFEHHVVRDVDDVADGADSGVAEPPPHPVRRGADVDALHDAGAVAHAEVRRFDRDGGGRTAVLVPILLHDGDTRAERLPEGDGGFTRQAFDAQTVRPVGGDLEVDRRLPEAEDLVQV